MSDLSAALVGNVRALHSSDTDVLDVEYAEGLFSTTSLSTGPASASLYSLTEESVDLPSDNYFTLVRAGSGSRIETDLPEELKRALGLM